MAQIKITKRSVDTIRPSQKPAEYRDSELKGFLIRCQPTGSRTYYFSYRNLEGKAKRIKLGKHGDITPDQARTMAKDAAGSVASSKDPQADKKAQKSEAKRQTASTLGAFVGTQYETHVKGTNKGWDKDIKRLKACFPDWWRKPLSKINAWLVSSWRTQQLNRGRKASGINRDVARLKGVLSLAVKWKVIDFSELSGFSDLKTDTSKKPRFLTPEEENTLKAALRQRDQKIRSERHSHNIWLMARSKEVKPVITGWYADYLEPLVTVALNTGMRRGELFSLQWKRVDLNRRLIEVSGDLAKSGKTRRIPINDNLLTVLSAWKKQTKGTGLVFPSPVTGGQLDNIKSAWGGLIKLAVLQDKGITFHSLRHTFATRLVRRNVDLPTIKELMGHSSINTTMIYAHTDEDAMRQAVGLL